MKASLCDGQGFIARFRFFEISLQGEVEAGQMPLQFFVAPEKFSEKLAAAAHSKALAQRIDMLKLLVGNRNPKSLSHLQTQHNSVFIFNYYSIQLLCNIFKRKLKRWRTGSG